MVKQNPFSIYDFLGYFIPGALVIYLWLLVLKGKSSNLEEVILTISSDKSFHLDNFLFFIILSYSVGHLINFLSSITIEKYSTWKYDYPSKNLMNLSVNNKYWTGTGITKFWKLVLYLILLPVTSLDYIIGELLKFKIVYTRKADDYIINSVKEKGKSLLNQLGTPISKTLREYDFHRIFAHYVYENSKNHQSKISNYVALYGFLRTLSLISVLTFWFLVYGICERTVEYYTFKEYWNNTNYLFKYILFIALISYVFFMAFMKFYRRYSLENLMLLVIDKDLKVPKRPNMNK